MYRNHRPTNPPPWDGSQALRFRSDPKTYDWHDEVMGELSTGPEVIDDFILIKSDGFPTYNFAHIIDDHLMKITHVIRSQEFLPSMPIYLNLYEALDIEPPIFATLPWIMAEGGTKKLSKRDGAKDILDYARDGYLPEAMMNFLATLGWNDGSEQEIFSTSELIAKFRLDQVQTSGARFDEQRLQWMNGAHIRGKTADELYELVSGDGSEETGVGSFWPTEAASFSTEYKKQVLGLVQERLKYFAELAELTRFFFVDLPINPKLISDHKQLKKLPSAELKNLLLQTQKMLQDCDFSLSDLTDRLNTLLSDTAQKPAVLFSLIRIATTQAAASPGLAETLAVLGKDRTLRRIEEQLSYLGA